MLGRRRGPGGPAALELGVVDEQVEGAVGRVEPDPVAVLDEGDRAAVDGLGASCPTASATSSRSRFDRPPEAIASTKRFFEPFIMADAERLDEVASREFALNCESPSSRKTFERFTVKS